MKQKTKWSLLALLYVNLLPYLCRLPQGFDWATQYLPDPDFTLFGLLFFHAFYSLPALPLIKGISSSKGSLAPWLFPFVVISAATCYLNYDYDLASDAQAAIGLMFFPIYAMLFGWTALLFGSLVQWYLTGRRPQEDAD